MRMEYTVTSQNRARCRPFLARFLRYGNLPDPTPFAPRQSAISPFAIKIDSGLIEPRAVEPFEGVDANNCILIAVDDAGDKGYHAAGSTDVKVGRLCAEFIDIDLGWLANLHIELPTWM